MSDTGPRRRIRAQVSLRDPATMRFILDAPVQQGRAASFDAPTDEAPLARDLFAIDGVVHVQVTGETILVTRATSHDWRVLKGPIAAAIRAVLDSTDQPLGDGAATPTTAKRDAELLSSITKLLDAKTNPSIASHGGHVRAESVENGTVYLRMSGGCQGCASSAVTLRQGVETMLRAALPTIHEIVDVTDHANGQRPYYRGTLGQSPLFKRPVPPDIFSWEGDQLRIAPSYLAPRLGLKAEDLQAGFSRGEIVIETGPGLQPEATRVVVRSAQRAWAADIAPDGTAQEVPPPRQPSAAGRTPSLPDRVRAYLEDLSIEEVPIAYGRLARKLGMFAPGSIRKITDALEVTMREDCEAGRPFVAARVVGRGAERLPGNGFFDLADALGRGPHSGETKQACYHRLLTSSFNPD